MKTAKRYSHVDCQICQNQKSNFIQNFRGRDFNVLSMCIFELLIFKIWLSFARQQVLSPSSIDHNPESWSISSQIALQLDSMSRSRIGNIFLTFVKVFSRFEAEKLLTQMQIIKHTFLWFMTVGIKFEPVPLPREALFESNSGLYPWKPVTDLKTSGVNF